MTEIGAYPPFKGSTGRRVASIEARQRAILSGRQLARGMAAQSLRKLDRGGRTVRPEAFFLWVQACVPAQVQGRPVAESSAATARR
jgi:hypothetical protein